ncbi:hypothetical protein RRG08_036258 [Elysia crispata]|uniref:Uncharacterized protein n=1 Tax=Elysia crispata TaxID=231223 RepID=A0AAE1D728_9GAST|nr:hypothetical protein RRG08_036258 [Elysia crispata]
MFESVPGSTLVHNCWVFQVCAKEFGKSGCKGSDLAPWGAPQQSPSLTVSVWKRRPGDQRDWSVPQLTPWSGHRRTHTESHSP